MIADETSARAGPDRRALDLCAWIAERAGAVGRCEAGHPGHVRRLDDRAEVRAFALLADAQKAGEAGRHSLEVLMRALTALLDATPPTCPRCALDRLQTRR